MRVVKVEAIWDPEVDVWVGVADSVNVVTEAPSIEALRERLKLIVPDMLEELGEASDDVSIEIVARVSDHVKLDAA